MELGGKLTAREMKDVAKLLRSRWYWPRWLLSNLYGLMLIGALLWGTIASAVSGHSAHWRALGVIWLVIAAIFVWAVVSTIRSQKRGFARSNPNLPDRIRLTDVSVETQSAGGRTCTAPWNAFRGWRANGSVILLDLENSDSFIILPTTNLSATDRDLLLGLLNSYLDLQEGGGREPKPATCARAGTRSRRPPQ
jgi:hypothetical protein